MYVGVTRAKEVLYLSYASKRLFYGETSSNSPSRFLSDIPENLLNGAVKEINDFDIYFKDRESFMLSLLDIRGLKDNLPVDEYPNDVEINFQYLDHYEFHYVCHTEKSVTFKPKCSEVLFQLIHQNFYRDVNEVFNDFDFTINMVGYDFELDEVVVHKDALLHLSQRILVTNSGTKYPQYLSRSESGHYILDINGIMHFIPAGWIHLQWKANPHIVT